MYRENGFDEVLSANTYRTWVQHRKSERGSRRDVKDEHKEYVTSAYILHKRRNKSRHWKHLQQQGHYAQEAEGDGKDAIFSDGKAHTMCEDGWCIVHPYSNQTMTGPDSSTHLSAAYNRVINWVFGRFYS